MKLKSILAASVLAALAALSINAQAASDTNTAVEAKTPPADMQGDKNMKPHSHMEEKTGVASKVASAEAKKPDPTKDKNRHLHPRDGK
ncbi:hypothetical protein [Denitratisoma oestradiolicum]|uniref:Pentapeptide MXKDX repeat protein n=1 Tax=Denitratisoma oestradiolicum TaxID=311182 RepID=A0A6S6XXH2_9PROT|nr:hypothetical protein [Denitratisoma oestradiolicum]TWO82095.1 hypothetical protein CBW56_01250 [Denitratisoma oestradiolicum]CAB1369025.1 conserved exported protein of unknown function [Denitratisoma oestradiolicum]